ncbi:MAG: AbrB/MazE/SpoVT family DNA-binding domain-containing protein [Candidatus Bipolaricaulis sp.]|nr:AbrB/MazE/SpoVT family DNA-binding domain-containing protein [Candidatus Bipolaricaulis sp.]
MATDKKAEVWLGKQGRLVIPAPLRRALGLEPGERLIASVEDGRLILERRREILARVKARFSQVPAEVGLADELIAERRAEARKDDPE